MSTGRGVGVTAKRRERDRHLRRGEEGDGVPVQWGEVRKGKKKKKISH